MRATPLSPKEQFIDLVAQMSGLSRAVLSTWVQAEGGPNDNPLNIGPGRHYGSASNAAAATLRVLHQSNMSMILRAAHGSDQQQIDAIAYSPWDTGHTGLDTAVKRHYLALLTGVYKSITGHGFAGGGGGGGGGGGAGFLAGIGGDISGAAGAVESGIVAGAGAVADPFTSLWGGITGVPHAIEAAVKDVETWAENAALRTLGYIVLTVVAILLFDQGLKRTLGLDSSPLGHARTAVTAAGAGAAGAGEIPF